jgi:hypothetical protein
MSASERDSLTARIRQIRGRTFSREQSTQPAAGIDEARLRTLEGRLSDLEQLVEGLQDSVHRESDRHAKLITELQTQVRPDSMGVSLAEDARNRGI